MQRSVYHAHRFPPAIIRHTVWLYFRSTLSLRDVKDLLAERGLDISYETIRRCVAKFGPLFARALRRRRPRPAARRRFGEQMPSDADLLPIGERVQAAVALQWFSNLLPRFVANMSRLYRRFRRERQAQGR